VAVVAEEVIMRGVEVNIFLAVASECGVPRSKDRELLGLGRRPIHPEIYLSQLILIFDIGF